MPSCRLSVIVHPRSRTQDVTMVDAKTLRVRVNAPPEHGDANAAVRAVLAKTFRVPQGRVLIVAGEFARRKIVVLPLSIEEVTAKLGGL